jgi:hypothetical protein
LENDIGEQSQNVPKGKSTLSLGRVPPPGVYFTRYRNGGETFTHSFLVLPASNNRFTVEIIAAPVATIEFSQSNNPATKKFFANLTANRLRAAATAVAPGWFAQNGQNFLVLTAKGVVLAYSGVGLIAIIAQQGIAKELFALTLDFAATVLARAADDLHQAQLLTTAERNAVKQIISGINGVAQTGLADGIFQKVISLGQGAADVVLGQDTDSQVTAKVTGDSVKKFHVLIGLNRLP